MENKFDRFFDRLMEILQVYLVAWGFIIVLIFIYNLITRGG